MKAHIYYYEFPRLKINLLHEVLQSNEWLMVETIKAPIGAYIYAGQWYLRGSAPYHYDKARKAITHSVVKPDTVPKEIRLMHLVMGGS